MEVKFETNVYTSFISSLLNVNLNLNWCLCKLSRIIQVSPGSTYRFAGKTNHHLTGQMCLA